ncbi:hypothetical protein ACE6H2_022481 [Prunus campanulata]
MDMETDKEGYLELFVKWYEDPEVLQMVKKRVARATLTTHIGNKNNSVIGNVNKGVGDMTKQELKWYENPEIMELKLYENPKIVQNLKEMFGHSLYEDGIPDLTSFLGRCPQGFGMHAPTNEMSLCIVLCRNRFAASPLEPRSRHIQKCCGHLYKKLGRHGGICFRKSMVSYAQWIWTTDPDIIVKAKQLVELLSIRIPVNEAIRVVKLSDMHCDIIQLGEGQYSVRLGRLTHYLYVGA